MAEDESGEFKRPAGAFVAPLVAFGPVASVNRDRSFYQCLYWRLGLGNTPYFHGFVTFCWFDTPPPVWYAPAS
jgi:hypothetical protein